MAKEYSKIKLDNTPNLYLIVYLGKVESFISASLPSVVVNTNKEDDPVFTVMLFVLDIMYPPTSPLSEMMSSVPKIAGKV